MTIQELKEKKRALEQEIAEKMLTFEKETDLRISGISMEHTLVDFNECDIEVNIVVKL